LEQGWLLQLKPALACNDYFPLYLGEAASTVDVFTLGQEINTFIFSPPFSTNFVLSSGPHGLKETSDILFYFYRVIL